MMTLQDYISQTNKKDSIEFYRNQAKEKNKDNPSVLRREDDYIQENKDQALSLPYQ